MIQFGSGLIMFSLVVAFACSVVKSDGRGKALTQSDADAICNLVKELRELRNNVTQNMKFGEKIVENGEKIVAYYSAKVEAKKMMLHILKGLIPEETLRIIEVEKLLVKMGEMKDELGNTITDMNTLLWAMRMPSWNLVNMSDSYAYWMKDMVEFFHHAAFGPGSCCLVVNGGAAGNCMNRDKRGNFPRDCTTPPLQRTEGGLAEYKNPLDKELSLDMGNAGSGVHSYYGCYITTTNESYIRGKKSFIYELSGGLFNTSGNALVANFTSVGKEFQDLIGPLSNSIGKISSGNTSVTRKKDTLDSLLLNFEGKVKRILERKKPREEPTEVSGIMKHAAWYDNESDESDGVVNLQYGLSGVTLFMCLFVVFSK